MDEALTAAIAFAVGAFAALAWVKWTLVRGEKKLDAQLKARGVKPPPTGRQSLADDPGSGNTVCVILRYNPYFSAYCVNTATGDSWYVPR